MKRSIKCMVTGLFVVMALCIWSVTSKAASPSNVKQIEATSTSVKIEWTAVSGATYYGYQVATDPGFQNIWKESYVSSKTPTGNLSITSLNTGSSYYVRIGWGTRYQDCFNEPSAPIEVVTLPADVGNVRFVGANDSSAIIEWDPSAGATEYMVKYNGTSYPVAGTSFAVPLVDGADNKAEVCASRTSAAGYQAVVNIGKSVYSLSKLTTKIKKSDFGILNNLSSIGVVYFGAICYGQGYEVQGVTVSGKKYQISGSDSTSSTVGARVSGVQRDRVYKYRMRAYINTTDGRKIYGNWSDYRLLCNQKKVTYVTSNRKIKLKWSKITGVSRIKVQISTKEKSGYKTCATLSGKKTGYTITKCGKSALKKGKTYYVRVVPYAKLSKKNVSSDTWIQGKVVVK